MCKKTERCLFYCNKGWSFKQSEIWVGIDLKCRAIYRLVFTIHFSVVALIVYHFFLILSVRRADYSRFAHTFYTIYMEKYIVFVLKSVSSTFFAFSAQQDAKQAEIELGRWDCWTLGVEVVVMWTDGCVWPVVWACTPPLSPPPPLPVVSKVRQLDAESPHPSATLQPCCNSHPGISIRSVEF